MNIESEIEFYKKQMSKAVSEYRSHVVIDKKLVRLPYETSSRPAGVMPEGSRKLFDYAHKAIREISAMSKPDERRIAELRKNLPKGELR